MKKDVRGLVKNNKGNGVYKRVYKIEFNYTDKIKIVIDECGYAVIEIETGKNEMARVITFKNKEKYYNDLNNVKNGKDKKTYVLTCEEEPYKGHDNNIIKDIVKKIENEVIEEKTKTDSPICNKAMEGVKSLLSDLNNESDRVFKERINLKKREEKIEEELHYLRKDRGEKEEEKKNVRIELNEAINTLADKDEVSRLYDEYSEKVREIEEINKSITEKKNQITNISTEKMIKTKKIQNIERLLKEVKNAIKG